MRFPSNRRPIQEINGDLFIVHAEYPESRVKDITLIKSWLGVDSAFVSHRNNTILFCEKIIEVKSTPIT
jgi:hypothetical protein